MPKVSKVKTLETEVAISFQLSAKKEIQTIKHKQQTPNQNHSPRKHETWKARKYISRRVAENAEEEKNIGTQMNTDLLD